MRVCRSKPRPDLSRKTGLLVANLARCVLTSSAAGFESKVSALQEVGRPGWDLHRLEEGKRLVIGGIEIPHSKGTIAHSDGDVVLHTITDAILGALCQPDIGQLFPDKDPKWKGAASDVFLLEAVKLMQGLGYALGNIDVTVIAERPKLSPHKQRILDNLCGLLNAPADVINLKAKTSEGVDALGENRAIACEAVVMLIRKDVL